MGSNTQPCSSNRLKRAGCNTSRSARLLGRTLSHQTTFPLPAMSLDMEILTTLADSAAIYICKQFQELKALIVAIFCSEMVTLLPGGNIVRFNPFKSRVCFKSEKNELYFLIMVRIVSGSFPLKAWSDMLF